MGKIQVHFQFDFKCFNVAVGKFLIEIVSKQNVRCMVELAVKGLESSLKEYEKSPETHPLYPEEWKLFWNRRYKELQAGSYRRLIMKRKCR